MLQNRLRKNARHRFRQAKREGYDALRLYDRDIPEIPLIIDWYAGRLYVAGFQREDEVEEDPEFVQELSLAAAECLQVPKELVYLRHRQKQHGNDQYTRRADSWQGRQESLQRRFTVTESGLKFYVNLEDYLDTGLFIHHRLTRSRFESEAAGRDVLNLFAYTGSFTVYAARGGARSTTTVDLSATYLAWAEDNLKLNGLYTSQNRLIQGDARAFAQEIARDARRDGPEYDLIIADPPTFSNSKRMEGTFDVIRDHKELLADLYAALRPGGVLYFSNNSKHFRLTAELDQACPNAIVEDITASTTPPDFQSHRPHRCWRIQKP